MGLSVVGASSNDDYDPQFCQGSFRTESMLHTFFGPLVNDSLSMYSIKWLAKGLCVTGPTLETGARLLLFTLTTVTIEAEPDGTKLLWKGVTLNISRQQKTIWKVFVVVHFLQSFLLSSAKKRLAERDYWKQAHLRHFDLV